MTANTTSPSNKTTINIIDSKCTINSISLLLKPTNISHKITIDCYSETFSPSIFNLLSSLNWNLVNTKTLPITNNIHLISFNYLQSETKHKISMTINNTKISEEIYITLGIISNPHSHHQHTKNIGNDIESGLDTQSMQHIIQSAHLSSKIYISPQSINIPNSSKIKTFTNENTQFLSCDWISKCKQDWLWTINRDKEFWKLLLINGVFLLPHSYPILLCPHPKQRMIIDFRAFTHQQLSGNMKNEEIKGIKEEKEQSLNIEQNINQNKRKQKKKKKKKRNINQIVDHLPYSIFGRSKKVKKYKKQFYLSVNVQFEKNIQLCKNYHSIGRDHNGKAVGTWITDSFAQIISQIMDDRKKRFQQEIEKKDENIDDQKLSVKDEIMMDDVLRFVCFELWEKKTLDLCAVTFSYGIGSVLCDYTCLTVKKDVRSCGNILTKVVGDVLLNCNFDVWYWGFLLEYMKDEYCNEKYHGREIPKDEFYSVLKNSYKNIGRNGLGIVNCKNECVLDMVEYIKNGQALVEPLPNW